MFADIVGSTSLITGLDAEQAMALLQPTVAAMCAAVQRFDGTVVRALGDGIMALFGAPRAQEGHALLACEAALAMQAEASRGNSGPRIRIGLHSGEVISSVLASDPTREQGAHGLTVHLASRLQGMAEPGRACLTEDCYRLVGPYCDVRPLGRRALKGFPEPIDIYVLLGLKPAVASQQFRGTHLASFCDRHHEIDILRRALQHTEVGDARVIGISGSPGSGKSRLCYEFAEWCRARDVPVLEARAQLYGHATPLQPALEFLRLLFRILPSDAPSVARQRIAQRMAALGPTFEADLPLLCDFLGISESNSLQSGLLPKTKHARLLEIVRHIVRQDGAAISVIIVEDLHWMDEASDDFVMTLVDAVAGTQTMLVLNYRPSYKASWMKWPYYQDLPLAELSPEETTALVDELIGDRMELRGIRQGVVDRSAGNPFFAEELVRSLSDQPKFFGDAGDPWSATKMGQEALPATVEAVIGARIDRLGEGEKAVLQVGAIIGKEFTLEVLEQVIGPLATPIETVLGRLCESELLQEQATIDGRQFAFRHPLMQEVAYTTQLKARRGTLHASVAKAMERFHKNRLDEFAGLLAYHYEAAGELVDAANYAARAAMWVGSTNPAQAMKHWQKVRSLLQRKPRSRQTDSLRIMASGQMAWLGWREGMTADAARRFLQEAIGWARETDDTMIPMLLFVDGRITVATGGSADIYVERVREALSLLNPGQIGRIATLNCALSQAYGWAGRLNEALAANDAALHGVSEVEKGDHQFLGYNVENWALSLRGRILVRLGRFADAVECFEMMLRIEQTLLDPTVRIIPHYGYVDLAWCRRDAALAKQHAARVTEIAQVHGSPYLRVFAWAASGTAKNIANDFEGAARDFSESIEFARKSGAAMEFEPEVLASLADCYDRMNQMEKASSIAHEAIEIARRRSARLPECRASITRGIALLAQRGAPLIDEVEDLFRRAEDLIEVSGARIYQPILREARSRMADLIG